MNLTEVHGTIVKEIIKGSAERIFEALTNPDQRMTWWGAEGRFQTTEWNLTCASAADGPCVALA